MPDPGDTKVNVDDERGPYERISNKEITAAAEHDPMRALLMLQANATLGEAEEQATLAKPHEPTLHESGWHITIDTPQGAVGLWSCWLDNQFHIGYPKDVEQIPDQVIKEALGVEDAKPVANDNFGTRQWAKFYGPQREDNGGRVWVDASDFHSYGISYPQITDRNDLEEIYYGHEQSRSISTLQFSFFSETEPEAPTAAREVIRPYREKFLDLVSRVAEHMGGTKSISIDYGFVLVPEQLPAMGYENITWLRGSAGSRSGWGSELVRAEKETESGRETIMLKSGNSLVPWSTIRRVESSEEGVTPEQLKELLTF